MMKEPKATSALAEEMSDTMLRLSPQRRAYQPGMEYSNIACQMHNPAGKPVSTW